MLRKLTVLVLALTLGAAPLGAQQDVTPEQVEALKERIADIDRWLADAEEDRSTLEQQLAATERKISTLTRERRTLRQQAREQQERLAELRAQESELANTLEQQRENLKLQIRAAWMEGDAPALKVLLNEIEPGEVARTLTYYEYLSKNTVSRLEAFQRSLQELKAARAAVQATRTELAKTEADLEQRQQQLTQSRQDRARTLAARDCRGSFASRPARPEHELLRLRSPRTIRSATPAQRRGGATRSTGRAHSALPPPPPVAVTVATTLPPPPPSAHPSSPPPPRTRSGHRA